MTETVYKYQILPRSRQEIQLPAGSTILTVGKQPSPFGSGDGLFLWARVNADVKELVDRTFLVVGTGHGMQYDANTESVEYLGTVMEFERVLVFHVFEVIGWKVT